MSKSLKMVIGIAAAVVMPYAAPALAGMIGLSGAVSTALGVSTAMGSTIAGGLTGAALGAGTSAALGGDVGKGALFGALGGGLGGYSAAAKAAQAGSAGAAGGAGTGAATTAATTAAPAATSAAAPVGTGTVLAPEAAGVSSGMSGATGFTPAAGMGIMPAGAAPSTGMANLGAASGTYTPAAGMGIMPANGASAASTGGYTIGGTGINIPTNFTAPPAQSFGQRLTTGLKTTWNEMTTPENLADAAVNTGKYLAGSLAAGSGMSAEEEAMLRDQRRELRRAQDANAAANETRRSEALKLINEANYYDPEYTGLQSARDAQLRGARTKQAGLRGLTGGTRQAEARRFDLGTNRATGAAYDQGYQKGIGARTQTRVAGINALPTGYDTTTSDYTSIASQMGDYERRRQQRAEDIGTLFGDITGEPKSKRDGG